MRKCKICGSTQLQKLMSLCKNMKILGSEFPAAENCVMSCSQCGFVFDACEGVEQKHFDSYYRSSNSKTVNYYELFPKKLAEGYVQHIFDSVKDHISPSDAVLDIAGGYGELSKYFFMHGYTNITMLDMKRECADFAKGRGGGIRVIEGSLFDRPFGTETYDLILCSHTMEHFIDVDCAMNIMCQALKPNGHLYLEVPDIERYVELDRAPYHFLTYEHVSHFSRKTIENLAAKYKLDILFLEKYIKCEDYPCLYTLLTPNKQRINRNMEYDPVSEVSMRSYLRQCKEKIKTAIDQYQREQTPLILWGIGASTAQLLNQCFDVCNVIQLIDSNPSRQGVSFQIADNELPVEGPEAIQDSKAVILILPTAYKQSIESSIRRYGLTNPVASLDYNSEGKQ